VCVFFSTKLSITSVRLRTKVQPMMSRYVLLFMQYCNNSIRKKNHINPEKRSSWQYVTDLSTTY